MPVIEPVSIETLLALLGPEHFALWQRLVAAVDGLYSPDKTEKVWHTGGKAAAYELKFRRAGKTLVSLFPKRSGVGLMVVLGAAERQKFEAAAQCFSAPVVAGYNAAATYHDGKWIMYNLPDGAVEADLPALLAVKRKPDKA